MRLRLALPYGHPPDSGAVTTPPAPRTSLQAPPPPSRQERWQVVKDKLAVAAVLLLVLATITVFVLYLVNQAPYFQNGEFTSLATPVPEVAQATGANAPGTNAANSIAGTGLGRIPLILISTVVEMGIFVALGLYLRHDMKRKS